MVAVRRPAPAVTGPGASVSLSNAVSGSTTGSLNLYQNAYGGNGGDAAHWIVW